MRNGQRSTVNGQLSMMALVVMLVAMVAGCGGAAEPTATPTKTPTPYQEVVSSTETPTPAHSTDAPLVTGEVTATPGALVQVVVDAAFDEALRFVLERDPATVTADQLTAALLSVVRRLAAGERSPALLDACGTVAAGAAQRASGDGATALGELAAACQAGDEGRLAAAVGVVAGMVGR